MMPTMIDMLRQIERDKGVPLQALVDAMQDALASAYRRKYGGEGDNVRVELDHKKSEFRVYARKTVVELAANPHTEIAWRAAQRHEPKINLGETLEVEVTPEDFGRIAAQTAKQVILQRIREAERESIYSEFSGREGELVNGEVVRKERRNVFVQIGRVEALLPASEQVHNESCRTGERMKLFVLEVRKTPRTPQVVVSRSHPNLVRLLFELEVPEIRDKIVELKSIAREAGARTKIAVHSNEANVDPVGACVGQRGQRVQAVVDELGGEKIDIIKWNQDIVEFIKQSLSPAKVASVVLHHEDQSALVIVSDDQQSLAIGRLGQNVRLAARLTGWKLDIRTVEKHEEEKRAAVQTAAAEVAAAQAAAVEAAAAAEEAAAAAVVEAAVEETAGTDTDAAPGSPLESAADATVTLAGEEELVETKAPTL